MDKCNLNQNNGFYEYKNLKKKIKMKVYNKNLLSEKSISKKDYLDALFLTNAIKIAPNIDCQFILRNGSLSMIYIDHAEIMCQNESYSPLIKAIHEKLSLFSSKTSILTNVDSKSSPQIVGALAFISKFRQIVVNPIETSLAEKGLNLQVRYPSNILSSDTCIVVDDVYTNNDKTAIDVISRIKLELTKNKINVPLKFCIIVGLNRSNKQQVKSNEGELINIYSVLTMQDIFFAIKDTLSEIQKYALFKEFGQEASILFNNSK